MAYNTGNIDIYESKNFDLLANYDRSEGRKYEYAEIDIDGEIGTTVGWEHNYKTAIFDTDDKYIYTLCTDGSIHKWK